MSVCGATSGGLCHHVESLDFVLQQTRTEFQNLEMPCEIMSEAVKGPLSRDMGALLICVVINLLQGGFDDGHVLPMRSLFSQLNPVHILLIHLQLSCLQYPSSW